MNFTVAPIPASITWGYAKATPNQLWLMFEVPARGVEEFLALGAPDGMGLRETVVAVVDMLIEHVQFPREQRDEAIESARRCCDHYRLRWETLQ